MLHITEDDVDWFVKMFPKDLVAYDFSENENAVVWDRRRRRPTKMGLQRCKQVLEHFLPDC